MFIFWPHGRDAQPVPFAQCPSMCLHRSPDGNFVCGRESGHEANQQDIFSHIHIAFATQRGGAVEHVAEWTSNDRLGDPTETLDRKDRNLISSPTQAPPPVQNHKPAPPPPEPVALISKDCARSYYGEVYELDLIPDATDEDYRTLPTLEQLNKMRGR